jgi:c-di-GMP-related signal transduction protein
VVLEVLETVRITDEVVDGITTLVNGGYRIALDDFVRGSGHERLFGLASYVKLDLLDGDLMVTALARARLCENVAALLAAPADPAFMAGMIPAWRRC